MFFYWLNKSIKPRTFIMPPTFVFITVCTLSTHSISIAASEPLSAKVSSFFRDAIQNAKSAQDKARLAQLSTEIEGKLTNYNSTIRQCQSDKESADTRCAESNNKGWTDFVGMMGQANDMASMAMSASCSKIANLFKMGQGAAAGFRAQCLSAKNSCETSCKTALKLRNEIASRLEAEAVNVRTHSLAEPNPDKWRTDGQEKTLSELQGIYNPTSCKHNLQWVRQKTQRPNLTEEECHQESTNLSEEAKGIATYLAKEASQKETLGNSFQTLQQDIENDADQNSPSALLKACGDKQQVLAKTNMNLMNLASAMQQNQACADEFSDLNAGIDLKNCALTGTCVPSDLASDCTKKKYKDSIYCKSYTGNPGGGGGGNGNIETPNPDFSLPGKDTFSSLDPDGLNSGAYDGSGGAATGADGAASKSAGVPGGHGGGGLNLPGGGYNPPRGGPRGVAGAGDDSPGYTGAGGGGAGFRAGGSGNGSKEDLGKYLPGGEKDPSLAKKGGPDGITPPLGGLTLFEKVSRGYKNSRTSLIPD